MADKDRPIQIELIILAFAWFAVGLSFAFEEWDWKEPTPTPTVAITATPTITNTPTPTNTAIPTPTEVIIESLSAEEENESGLIAPTFEEVEYMAKVIHGEATGCTEIQKAAVAWCVCNRVDSPSYPDNVIEVITEPYQFHGYKDSVKADASDYAVAWEVLYRWYNDLDGRVLPTRFLYFYSEGKGYNIFTTDYRSGEVWKEE